jgi:choice-of-anchor C domain-containing protein
MSQPLIDLKAHRDKTNSDHELAEAYRGVCSSVSGEHRALANGVFFTVTRAAAAILLMITCSIQAFGRHNLLLNGSFEEGPDPGSFRAYEAGSTAIRGWKVTRAMIDYVGSKFPASHGERSLDLDGTPGFGGIEQTFSTTPGQIYIVSFDLAGNPQGPPATKKLRVTAAGQAADFSHDASLNWSHETWKFKAAEQSTTIEFYSLDAEGGYCGPLLDSVSVTGAPRNITGDAIFGANLILNGDAEAGPGSPTGNEVVPALGWTTIGSFTVVQYGGRDSQAAEVGPDDPGPVNRGKNFFAGGPDNASSSAVQIIDVSAGASAIDRAEVSFDLAGYLGGWQGQEDHAALVATFLDVNGTTLRQITLGPVTAEDRRQKTGLFPLSKSGMLPKGTREIEFELQMTRAEGTYNDGYADNLSFRLYRPGLLQSLFRQAKIWLNPDKPSALPGQSITIEVVLGYSPDAPTLAEHDVHIDLEAKGAEVRPKAPVPLRPRSDFRNPAESKCAHQALAWRVTRNAFIPATPALLQ